MANDKRIDMNPNELVNYERTQRVIDDPGRIFAVWELAVVEEVNIYRGQIESKGIGHIRFRRLQADSSKAFEQLLWAKPFATTAQYPVKGELVMIAVGPSEYSVNGSMKETEIPRFYYSNPINYREHINTNAKTAAVGTDINYSTEHEAETLMEDSNADTSNDEINIETPRHGLAFIPSTNIWPLQPLEGDYIMQGRFGSSIRLGHSQISPEGSEDPTKGFLDNPWSDNEDSVDGDPITIIRNGQDVEMDAQDITKTDSPGAIFETLKGDGSSIWLTAGQTINSLGEIFSDTGEEGTGVGSTSRMIKEGLGNVFTDLGRATPSAIISSDRIIFLAKEDEVILFGKTGIALSSDGPITIETKDPSGIVFEGNVEFRGAVQFGDNAAIDGEKLNLILEELIDEVSTLKVSTATGPGTALPSAGLQGIKDKLDDLLITGEEA
jgi:hypothetical protein